VNLLEGQDINVEKILKDLGIIYHISGGKDARTKCWDTNHKDDDPSMSIELTTGAYHCFGCGLTGHILQLVKGELGLDEIGVQQYIKQQAKGGSTEETVYNHIQDSMNQRLPSRKKIVDITPPITKNAANYFYLAHRGLTNEEIEEWKIGIVDMPGDPYNSWVYVPIYSNNVLRTWFLRSPYTSSKIYGYYNDENGRAKGYKRSDILFGLDKIPKDIKKVYLLEGIFDKIWFDRTANNSLAVLSNRILPEQMKLLGRFEEVVLVPDNDLEKKDEGLLLIYSGLSIPEHVKKSVCILPLNRNDANNCSLEEMLLSTYKEISIYEFIKTERYLQWSLRKSNLPIFQG
jgi:hypothetical protein